MGLDLTVKVTDIAIVLATIVGPIAAIQIQKWLERRGEANARRLQIFRVLMATRAVTLSPGHVEALNAIPIEFYGPTIPKLKSITDDWRTYQDHLDRKDLTPELWAEKRRELLTNLLFNMSQYLGYKFSRSEIERVYYPTGHGEMEIEQSVIRKGMAKLFTGEFSLPMEVTGFPVDDEALMAQKALFTQFSEWLDGKRAVKIEPAGE